METSDLLKKVKDNKKYRTLSDDIVNEEINSYLKKNPDPNTKVAVKEIRSRLHRLYSSYQTKKKNKRKKYLEVLRQLIKDSKPLDEINDKLLSITLSTKERIEDYSNLYREIFKITGNPKSIIDLGCGLNPLSYPLMNLRELSYYAYDIDEEDIEFLNQYFKIMKQKRLNGKAKILDARNLQKIKKLPRADIAFMFKLLDLLDEKNKKISEKLITTITDKKITDYIVVSFATKTLTRKPMNLPRRIGFEKMLERNNLKFESIKISNEIFYIIKNI